MTLEDVLVSLSAFLSNIRVLRICGSFVPELESPLKTGLTGVLMGGAGEAKERNGWR